jgi:hypothetical protein
MRSYPAILPADAAEAVAHVFQSIEQLARYCLQRLARFAQSGNVVHGAGQHRLAGLVAVHSPVPRHMAHGAIRQQDAVFEIDQSRPPPGLLDGREHPIPVLGVRQR